MNEESRKRFISGFLLAHPINLRREGEFCFFVKICVPLQRCNGNGYISLSRNKIWRFYRKGTVEDRLTCVGLTYPSSSGYAKYILRAEMLSLRFLFPESKLNKSHETPISPILFCACWHCCGGTGHYRYQQSRTHRSVDNRGFTYRNPLQKVGLPEWAYFCRASKRVK